MLVGQAAIPLSPAKFESIGSMDLLLKKVMFLYKFPIFPNPGDAGQFLVEVVERLAISVQWGFEPQ